MEKLKNGFKSALSMILVIAVITTLFILGPIVYQEVKAGLDKAELSLADLRKLHGTLRENQRILEKKAAEIRRNIDNRVLLKARLQIFTEEYEALPFYSIPQKFEVKKKIFLLEAELKAKQLAFDALRNQKNRLDSELEQLNALIRAKSDSFWVRVKSAFQSRWVSVFLHVALILLLTPVLWCLLEYYVFAAFVGKCKPFRFDVPFRKGAVDVPENSAPQLSFPLSPGESVFTRAKWVTKRENVSARTKFLWSWRSVLISLLADLVEMVEFRAENGRTGKITFASPEDADDHILRIDLKDSPGIVLKPRCVVALTPGIRLKTRWSFQLHNLLSGRLRQIIFYGTGTIVITGYMNISHDAPGKDAVCRIEDGLILGYDMSMCFSLVRTETFWHYYRGKASLFDFQVLGEGAVFTQARTPRGRGLMGDTWLVRLIRALGQFIGF
ncbi:MAG: hypothetical protein BWY31_04289 [Lentisphaerae bacterium ADurb.Bin242]|nr:MAG: hypothetical protein BWY31_04289 [Lentisphaerae bacterium ADurb.Bin242]